MRKTTPKARSSSAEEVTQIRDLIEYPQLEPQGPDKVCKSI
jgi:hypothetical protein